MKQKHVLIITDCKDAAFNEMKLAIIQECYKNGFDNIYIELIPVYEFSIINAAFITRLMADYCPPGTILSLVINPQKQRSSRIYGKISNGIIFFGANTGAFSWLFKDFHVEELYEIHDPGFISFGGKYVHAPNVAKLAMGVPFDQIGKTFNKNSLNNLDIKDGTVVHIDNFGLIKIKGDKLNFKDGTKFKIFKNGKYILDAVFADRMMSKDDKEWVLYNGSSLDSMPELGTVRYTEGYKDIKVNIGDVITWKKLPSSKK